MYNATSETRCVVMNWVYVLCPLLHFLSTDPPAAAGWTCAKRVQPLVKHIINDVALSLDRRH